MNDFIAEMIRQTTVSRVQRRQEQHEQVIANRAAMAEFFTGQGSIRRTALLVLAWTLEALDGLRLVAVALLQLAVAAALFFLVAAKISDLLGATADAASSWIHLAVARSSDLLILCRFSVQLILVLIAALAFRAVFLRHVLKRNRTANENGLCGSAGT